MRQVGDLIALERAAIGDLIYGQLREEGEKRTRFSRLSRLKPERAAQVTIARHLFACLFVNWLAAPGQVDFARAFPAAAAAAKSETGRPPLATCVGHLSQMANQRLARWR